MKLYKIAEQHKELLKLADESEDMAIAVADTMESIEGDFEDKSISLIHVVNNMATDVIAIDTEIARLTARKKSITNKQESMIEYLRINMESSDIKYQSLRNSSMLSIGQSSAFNAVITHSSSMPRNSYSFRSSSSCSLVMILAASISPSSGMRSASLSYSELPNWLPK